MLARVNPQGLEVSFEYLSEHYNCGRLGDHKALANFADNFWGGWICDSCGRLHVQ